MRKMGNFKGLPVFMVSDIFEWQNVKENHSHEERIFVYKTNVYYKNYLIASISGDILMDFDEDLFNELRRKNCDEDKAQMTGSAETSPQEDKKPVNEYSEPAAADEFMAHWSEYIDNELTMLKSSVAQLGEDLNAVG